MTSTSRVNKIHASLFLVCLSPLEKRLERRAELPLWPACAKALHARQPECGRYLVFPVIRGGDRKRGQVVTVAACNFKKELKSSQRRNEHMRVEESGGWDKWESRAVDAVGGNSDWHPVWKPVVSACDEPEPDMFKVEASFHSSPCLRLSKKWNGLTSSVAESRPVTQLGLCHVPVQDERDGFSPVSVWVLGPLYCNSIKGFRGSLCPRGPPLFSFFVFSDQLDKQL